MRYLRSLLLPLFLLVAAALPARAQGTRIKDLPLTTSIPADGRIALDASTFTALRGISIQQLSTNLGTLVGASKLDTTNGVAVSLTTPTAPTTGNAVVNKAALDAAIAAIPSATNKIDVVNGISTNLQSTSISSLYANSVVKREYLDYVGSTNLNNWMAIQTWGDSLTEGSGVGGVTSSNTYPAQLGTYSGFRVANGGVGGQTAPQILVRQTAASNTWFQPTIIWAGRNEYWYPTNVLNGVSNMVANLRAGGNTNRFLVLSVLNGNYSGDERGGANYQIITNINAQFAAAYGQNYLDVRSYLVSRYSPTNAQDILDYANDIPPSTLRSDGIHLNEYGYPTVAAYILTNGIATLRGAWGPSVRPSGVTAILRQPGPIGSEVKNTGDFTSLTGNTLGVGSVAVTNGLTAQSLASVSSSVGTGTATNSYISPAFTVTGSGYSSTAYLSGNGALWVFTGGLAPDSNNTRDLGIGGLAWRNITATGAITAGSASLASETLGSLTLTNGITAGSLTASGSIASATSTTGSAVATNSFKAPAILVQGSGSSFGTLSLSGDNSAIISDKKLMPATEGTLSLGYGYNSYQWLHGFFSGKLWSDSLQTTNAAIAALTAGTITTTNAVTAASVTASGALAAASANITGAVNSGSAATGSLVVTNGVTAASAVITNSFTVGGTLTGGASRFNSVYITNSATANVLTLFGGGSTVSAYLGGSGSRWVLTGGLDPASDAAYSLGQGGLRWLNAVLSGTVTASKFTSEVATGTAPLTVASTTEVANLRAATATAMATARTINGVAFDGTANVTVTAAAATLTGLGTGLGTALGLAPTGSGVIVLATNAVLTTPTLGNASATSIAVASAASAGSIVSFGSITAGGNITGLNLSGNNTGDQTSVSGNAGTATTLATGRTIAINGDLTWTSPSFNGSGNVTAAATLASSGVAAGAYGSASYIPTITVDAKGRVTGITTNAVSGGGSTSLSAVFTGTNLVTGINAGSAFASGSATITIAGHGLSSGDAVWFQNNACGPDENRTYFATYISSSQFKVSTSQPNRLASTYVTATANGTAYARRWTDGGAYPVGAKVTGIDGVSRPWSDTAGAYIITFTSAQSDANYQVYGSAKTVTAGTALHFTVGTTAPTTSAVVVQSADPSGALADTTRMSVTIAP